jgi:hypothetical protein
MISIIRVAPWRPKRVYERSASSGRSSAGPESCVGGEGRGLSFDFLMTEKEGVPPGGTVADERPPNEVQDERKGR